MNVPLVTDCIAGRRTDRPKCCLSLAGWATDSVLTALRVRMLVLLPAAGVPTSAAIPAQPGHRPGRDQAHQPPHVYAPASLFHLAHHAGREVPAGVRLDVPGTALFLGIFIVPAAACAFSLYPVGSLSLFPPGSHSMLPHTYMQTPSPSASPPLRVYINSIRPELIVQISVGMMLGGALVAAS